MLGLQLPHRVPPTPPQPSPPPDEDRIPREEPPGPVPVPPPPERPPLSVAQASAVSLPIMSSAAQSL